MDYLIKADLNIRNDQDLLLLFNKQQDLNKNPIKTGKIRRLEYNDRPDLYKIDVRFDDPKKARRFYQELCTLMETGNIPGWAAWHECKHDEANHQCHWDEEYRILPGVE